MHAITLCQIEIFRAAMTTGNLTEAAMLLHTSQATVSRELAHFKKQMQLQLFARVRGRLSPTMKRLRLFEEVQRSYYGLDRIVNAARQHPAVSTSTTLDNLPTGILPIAAASCVQTLY